MKRIDKLLGRKTERCDYPEDVRRMKDIIPELQDLSNAEVERLYGEFSEDLYCAGWLVVNTNSLYDFERWLNADDGFDADGYEEDHNQWKDNYNKGLIDDDSDKERQADQQFVDFMKKHGLKKQ